MAKEEVEYRELTRRQLTCLSPSCSQAHSACQLNDEEGRKDRDGLASTIKKRAVFQWREQEREN